MGTYKEVYGDLIKLATQGEFDVIAHGCNCWNTMRSGLAPQMVRAFGTDKFKMENQMYRGDINKLGTIDYEVKTFAIGGEFDFMDHDLAVVNCYTQYGTARYPGEVVLEYAALELCFIKMNHIFKGKKIGLPLIGGGLAGGKPNVIKNIIKTHFPDCDVTLVLFEEAPVKNNSTLF